MAVGEGAEIAAGAGSVHVPLSVMDRFDGTTDADMWLSKFKTYCKLRKVSDADTILTLPLYLKGPADVWYHGLSEADGESGELINKFKVRFQPPGHLRAIKTEQFQLCKMSQSEDVEIFVDRLSRLGKLSGKSPEDIRDQAILGLPDHVKIFVIGKEPQTIEDVIKYSRMASFINAASTASSTCTDVMLTEIRGTFNKETRVSL